MRERPTLDWIPLALLVALTLGLRPHAPAPPPPPAPVDGYEQLMDAIAGALQHADALYRAGDPAAAAQLISDVTTNGDYDTLIEQYTQLARARAIARDPKSTAIEAF